MNEGIEKGGRGLTHASAGLVAQADEAEAHLLAGSPPLFVFPGSLMLGTGSWDSCALSADILGRVVFRGVTPQQNSPPLDPPLEVPLPQISPSFADIFFNNCFKNGMLPIRLPEAQVRELMADADAGGELEVDLEIMLKV